MIEKPDRSFRQELRAYLLETKGDSFLIGEKLSSLYLETEDDALLLENIDSALTSLAYPESDKVQEGGGVLLIGETGSGKSTTIKRTLSRHPVLGKARLEGRSFISVRCLGAWTLSILAYAILRAAGYPVSREIREAKLLLKVRTVLKRRQILVLHIDEINNLVANYKGQADLVINQLKSFLNDDDWPIALILSGTPPCGPVLEADVELKRRLAWQELPLLAEPDDLEMVQSVLVTYAGAAGLTVSKATPDLIGRVIHAACARRGVVIEHTIKAACAAVARQSKELGAEDYAGVYARLTGVAADKNPFLVPDFRSVDTTRVLAIRHKAETQALEQQEKVVRRKGRR